MKFSKALGFKNGDTVAFIGAGGKTSAIFSLAEEIADPVVVTTSTHFGAWQAALAEKHQIIHSPTDLKSHNFEQVEVLLITGPAGEDDRLLGLDETTLNALRDICKERNITLLIEADGARQKSLKAPADHEPAVPRWMDQVVVMAGLSALGTPLSAESVHRPEIFSKLANLPMGEEILVKDVIAVLGSEEGGMKRMPVGCRKTLFLNQVEESQLKIEADLIAKPLAKVYDRVLVGSLHKPEPDGPIFRVYSQTAGVILAAGGSERLGRPKQLLDWHGVSFVRQVALNALGAGLAPLVVITGADRAQVEDVISDLPVEIVHNPEWAAGQSTSMKLGLGQLPVGCDSVMFLLTDQPQIDSNLIIALTERYAENRFPITAPVVDECRGNPVLFSQETFSALMAVSGDKGGRAVFNSFAVDGLPWVDARILLDVDTEEDVQILKQVYS